MIRWQCTDYAHIFFSLLHENGHCYGDGNSQNVGPVGDLCVEGNTCAFVMSASSMSKCSPDYFYLVIKQFES